MNEKKLFVACPMKQPDSEERKRSERLIKFIIEPVAKELDYEVIRPDKMVEPGRITTQVTKELSTSNIVVADLTGLNGNVMYELGVRQGLKKPYILVAEKGQDLPFDVFDVRTIFYALDLESVDAAKVELHKQIEAIDKGQGTFLDEGLFPDIEKPEDDGDQSGVMQMLLNSNNQILEAYGRLLRNAEETKELVQTVGQLVLQLQETKNQEMGIQFFGNIIEQGIQNPDGFSKIMDIFQTLQNSGSQAAPQEKAQGFQAAPKKQSTRKKPDPA